MTENDFDREITRDLSEASKKVRLKLGQDACPELVEMKAWAELIAKENDKLEGFTIKNNGEAS